MTTMAHLAIRPDGRWRLFVVVFGATSWPDYTWPRGVVPTVAERRVMLAGLGYEPVPGARWSWCEDSADPDDDRTAVVLIAAVTVRLVGGGS